MKTGTNEPKNNNRHHSFPISAAIVAAVLFQMAGIAQGDTSDGAIDWQATDQIGWDPESRQLVVDEQSAPEPVEEAAGDNGPESADFSPKSSQQISWDSLDEIRWDPETRRFVTIERSEPEREASSTFDARNYRLSVRDQIEFDVFDEPLGMTQRIDGSGQIRIPLLGNQEISGMTVREAEDFIEKLYVENRILRNPTVTIRVAEYAPREVAILGAVGSPGTQEFPIERNQMDIVEVVSRAGGFTGIARSNAVSVTRIDDDGGERTFTVDVESMITGSRRDGSERFKILPGDVIWVRERVF